MTFLAKQFFNKTVEREYYALVWGDVKNDSGEINEQIGRNPKNRLQMIVYKDRDGGKEAITNYKVIKRFGYVTLVSCKLTLGFIHPETKKNISFDSKIPNDISQVIDKWELYSKHKKL